jgi:hypothetical protein
VSYCFSGSPGEFRRVTAFKFFTPFHFWGTKHTFDGKIFNFWSDWLIWCFNIFFQDFRLSLHILSGSSHTNFCLLFTFEVLKILLFEFFFISIGWFGVSIIFLCFWVELANFVGQIPYVFLFYISFLVLNILFSWPSGVPIQNCK